jgi:hemerythrin-like domain-containing protein
MATASKIGAILHEEHFWTVVLVNGLETQLSSGEAAFPVDPSRTADRDRLRELIDLLDAMIRHHAFEERVLFPLISQRTSADMVALFAEEHAAMGPFVGRLRRVTVEILDNGMTKERLKTFAKALTGFSDYVMVHIQKEELALIQKLDRFLDADTDRSLALAYAEQKMATPSQAAE